MASIQEPAGKVWVEEAWIMEKIYEEDILLEEIAMLKGVLSTKKSVIQ